MLIHNGFNECAYGYCDRCGITALFDQWSPLVPQGIEVGFHGPLTPDAEKLARPCGCGGQFRGSAAPRCPHCAVELSAQHATDHIERNAPGTASGWCWQQTNGADAPVVSRDHVATTRGYFVAASVRKS